MIVYVAMPQILPKIVGKTQCGRYVGRELRCAKLEFSIEVEKLQDIYNERVLKLRTLDK